MSQELNRYNSLTYEEIEYIRTTFKFGMVMNELKSYFNNRNVNNQSN